MVQLYIHNVLGSVATPVKQLRGFDRLELKPGETKTAEFILTPDDLKILTRDMNWVVEPGRMEFMIGSSSQGIQAKKTMEVAQEFIQ